MRSFPKGYFDLTLAAFRANMTEDEIRLHVEAGLLPHIEIDGQLGFRLQAFNRWLETHRRIPCIPAELVAIGSAVIAITPASFSGIYFLYLEGAVQYVGKSVNVPSRLRDHADKRFNASYFMPVAPDRLDTVEREMILRFDPPINRMLKGA